jgi:hypothetical protein
VNVWTGCLTTVVVGSLAFSDVAPTDELRIFVKLMYEDSAKGRKHT